MGEGKSRKSPNPDLRDGVMHCENCRRNLEYLKKEVNAWEEDIRKYTTDLEKLKLARDRRRVRYAHFRKESRMCLVLHLSKCTRPRRRYDGQCTGYREWHERDGAWEEICYQCRK